MTKDFQNLEEPLELITPMPLDEEFPLPGGSYPLVDCDRGKIAGICDYGLI